MNEINMSNDLENDEDDIKALSAKHYRLLQGKTKTSTTRLDKYEFDGMFEDLYFKYDPLNKNKPEKRVEPVKFEHAVVPTSDLQFEKSNSVICEETQSEKSKSVATITDESKETLVDKLTVSVVSKDTSEKIDTCDEAGTDNSRKLKEAIDYLSKTCTDNYIISQAEYVKRLEVVIACLTKSIAVDYCNFRPKKLTCLQTAVDSLENEMQKTLNKTKSNSTGSFENEKQSTKNVDTRELMNQCRELVDLCTSLKKTVCKISKDAHPGEDFPICSRTLNYNDENTRENLRQRSSRRVNEKEHYNESRKKSSKLVGKKSMGTSNQDARKDSRYDQRHSYRPSDEDLEYYDYPSNPHRPSSQYLQEGRRRSSLSSRRQHSIQEYEGDNQYTGAQNNSGNCIQVSAFCMALFVVFVMVLAIAVFSMMIVVQFGPPKSDQLPEFGGDSDFDTTANREARYKCYQCDGGDNHYSENNFERNEQSNYKQPCSRK